MEKIFKFNENDIYKKVMVYLYNDLGKYIMDMVNIKRSR